MGAVLHLLSWHSNTESFISRSWRFILRPLFNKKFGSSDLRELCGNLIKLTHLTICLCLSTQYLMALLTSISCFFVNPFGPTPPLKVIPAVGRKVAVKSCRLLYMLRRSRSSMLSPCGGAGGGWFSFASLRRCSALPAYRHKKISLTHKVWNFNHELF